MTQPLVAALLALVALVAGREARAERLVVDLSTDRISITSEFGGTSIALFGVVERDAQTVSRRGKYDIAVIVTGPRHDVLVQRKARVFGIWMNAEGFVFRRLPSYLGIFTSGEFLNNLDEWIAGAARPDAGIGARFAGRRALFHAALSQAQGRAGLYVREEGSVRMLTDRFFRTLIPLPGVSADGDYAVTVHLFADGVLLDTHETEFRIAKVGFEERISDMARASPLLYGLVVVALALVTGYVGGIVFRRN